MVAWRACVTTLRPWLLLRRWLFLNPRTRMMLKIEVCGTRIGLRMYIDCSASSAWKAGRGRRSAWFEVARSVPDAGQRLVLASSWPCRLGCGTWMACWSHAICFIESKNHRHALLPCCSLDRGSVKLCLRSSLVAGRAIDQDLLKHAARLYGMRGSAHNEPT